MKQINIKINLLLLVLLLSLLSCSKEKVAPLTGDLKITVHNTEALNYSPEYQLYPESYIGSTRYASPIRSGRATRTFTLKDLNHGNYLIRISGYSDKIVQVTAGREREYVL